MSSLDTKGAKSAKKTNIMSGGAHPANRKMRIQAKMGKKELPAEVDCATEHVDAEHAKDTLKEVVAHLPGCGFANVAEAFVLMNENGDDWITKVEMEQALKHLRIDHINLNALMFAVALGGSDAGHYNGKIGFNQFLKHFTWKGGGLGKDSENALYEAKLKRKQILQHTEATLEAKESATVWPEEEIDRLLELVKKEGVGSWDEKAKELGTGRSGEEVRRHYHDVLSLRQQPGSSRREETGTPDKEARPSTPKAKKVALTLDLSPADDVPSSPTKRKSPKKKKRKKYGVSSIDPAKLDKLRHRMKAKSYGGGGGSDPRTLMKSYDPDHSGELEFPEFLLAVSSLTLPASLSARRR
jgi:Ca2+-binding EF-hand superfamily protein